MSDFSNKTLLVTGANGHFGRIAVEYLLAKGAKHVIAASRDPSKIEDLKAKGAETRKLDFDDAASLASAFAGVDRVLLISTDAIGKRVAQHTAAIEAAEKAGVQHIVYTSAPNANPNPDNLLGNEHYWTEQRLATGKTGWTALRNHLYAELNIWGAANALASGKSFDATGTGARNYVTRADAARAAAGALLTLDGKSILDVTGPAPVTQQEAVRTLSNVAGKPVERVGLNGAQLLEGMLAAGMPEGMAHVMVRFDQDAAQGFHAITTSVVKDLTGSDPQPLAAFLTDNKAALLG